MRKNRERVGGKSERVGGDALTYFIAHNSISIFLFFVVTLYLEIYAGKEQLIGFIFQREFWELTLFQIFPISVLCSLLGRIGAYYIINWSIEYKNKKRSIKKSTKRWGELNEGINRLGLVFVISALITSLIYSLGLVAILQFVVFNEESFFALISIYVIFKIGTHVFVRWLVGTKL